jgi:colicin import membrane protein
MNAQIVKIDPQEFGIEETKAADIKAQFQPMLDKMVELEAEFNEVVNLPIESPESAKKARELRLKYKKIRTGTADIHKKQKAFYLAGGRFVDGWKNAQEFSSLGKEDKLEEIEKYVENLEKQRLADLQKSRVEQLAQYEVENTESLNLSGMADNVWENFLAGTKGNCEAKKKAEQDAKEAEDKRLAEEAAKREMVRLENEELKRQAEALKALRDERSKLVSPYISFLADFNATIELSDEDFNSALEQAKIAKADYDEQQILKAEAEDAERQKQLDEQRKKNIEEAAKRKEAEEQAKKDREEKERVEKELSAEKQKQADMAAEAERLAEIELSKGDKEKMQSLISDLNELKTKYQFKSKKHNEIYDSICELISKTVAYAEIKR